MSRVVARDRAIEQSPRHVLTAGVYCVRPACQKLQSVGLDLGAAAVFSCRRSSCRACTLAMRFAAGALIEQLDRTCADRMLSETLRLEFDLPAAFDRPTYWLLPITGAQFKRVTDGVDGSVRILLLEALARTIPRERR